MRRLHVLHVIGGGDTGGAMTHLLPLLSALGRADCEVHLLCLGDGGLAQEASRRGVSVSVLSMVNAWDPSILVPLRRLLAGGPADLEVPQACEIAGPASRAIRWDVVHTHGMRANLPVRLAVRGRRRRPCVFTTVHSDLEFDYASPHLARVYGGLDRATLSCVDTVICVSDALRLLLVRRGYPAERLMTVRSGIESPQGWTPPPASAAEPASASGPVVAAWLASEPAMADPPERRKRPRVGTVARLVRVKDIDLLLDVAALLRRTFPEVEAVVVGDGPEWARLQTQVETRGLAGVVRFTGRLADVSAVLAEMDVYVVTSVFEGGVSMSVLEAMAAGIPVVTTAAGGVAEAVKEGDTGYVVTRDQERGALAAALAERAAALLADAELRARMGAAGARRVREIFLVERAAAATLRAYRRCLAARGDLM
ncbi:MAG: glycosyltransferase [bacterium]